MNGESTEEYKKDGTYGDDIIAVYSGIIIKIIEDYREGSDKDG